MDTIELLWEYTNWANEIVLMTLENYGQLAPASSVRLMSHIVNAQGVWSSRLLGKPVTVGIWDEHDIEICKQMNRQTLQGLRAVIDRQAGDYTTLVAYTNTSGLPFETALLDILLQAFNHGTYHRAQIAMDLRQQGLEPVNTDYISWVRATRR